MGIYHKDAAGTYPVFPSPYSWPIHLDSLRAERALARCGISPNGGKIVKTALEESKLGSNGAITMSAFGDNE